MCLWEKDFLHPCETLHKMALSQGLKESFFQQHLLVDFEYLFLMNLLALKFGTHVINIEMGSCQKFDGKKTIFSLWEGVKVDSSEIFPHNNTCW